MKTKSSTKFVIFNLGETQFGVEVLKTREIVEYGRITPVPEAPEYIDGVINLRGSVVPVVDLTKKFFNKKATITETTGIMIVEPEIDQEQTLMGIIVDTVKDVLEIKENHFVPAPKYGSKIKSEYIRKVASLDNEFILILDIDNVLSKIDITNEFTTITDFIEAAKTMKQTEE